MLSDQVSDKMEGLAGEAIGKKVSDFLNNSINEAMEKAADLVGNAIDGNDGKLLPILVQTGSGMGLPCFYLLHHTHFFTTRLLSNPKRRCTPFENVAWAESGLKNVRIFWSVS